MSKLRQDQSACVVPVPYEPKCINCIRNVLENESDSIHQVMSTFNKTFKDGSLVKCSGYIPKD